MFKRSQIKGSDSNKTNVNFVWGNKDRKTKLSNLSLKNESHTKSTYDIPSIIKKQEIEVSKNNFFAQPKDFATRVGKIAVKSKAYLSSINNLNEEVAPCN